MAIKLLVIATLINIVLIFTITRILVKLMFRVSSVRLALSDLEARHIALKGNVESLQQQHNSLPCSNRQKFMIAFMTGHVDDMVKAIDDEMKKDVRLADLTTEELQKLKDRYIKAEEYELIKELDAEIARRSV